VLMAMEVQGSGLALACMSHTGAVCLLLVAGFRQLVAGQGLADAVERSHGQYEQQVPLPAFSAVTVPVMMVTTAPAL